MIKVEMAKDIYLKSFWHLMRKMFCYSGRANSIKIDIQTCNLHTDQSVNYKFVNQFWLNLLHQNGKMFFTSNVKNFSHMQMDIFCYFNFCHCRRNNFCAVDLFKVWTFWEAHKKLRNLPHALYIYLVNVQTMRKIFSNFVCFSESPNFTGKCSKRNFWWLPKFFCVPQEWDHTIEVGLKNFFHMVFFMIWQ